MPLMITTLVLVLLGVVAAGWLASNRTAVPKTNRPTIAVTLRPGSTRSDGGSTQKVGKPPATAVVDFKLELGRNDYRKYRAELLRENISLATFESLEAQATDNHFEVEVIVDASLFEEDEGDYRFKLSGVSDSGQLMPTEEYGFRLSR
jgi:regulator of protease activity HflC (stomatin/prohibitin superfamily)